MRKRTEKTNQILKNDYHFCKKEKISSQKYILMNVREKENSSTKYNKSKQIWQLGKQHAYIYVLRAKNQNKKEKEKMKNTLVVYEGGGYDGCFWEWNAFLLNDCGRFVDIHSTGMDGVTCGEGAKISLKENDSSTHVIDLFSQEDCDFFDANFAPAFVVGVVEAVSEVYSNNSELMLHVKCDKCGEIIDIPPETRYTDVRGIGGIVSQAFTKLCPTCFEDGCCKVCMELSTTDEAYWGKENLTDGLCEEHTYFTLLDLLHKQVLLKNETTTDLINMFWHPTTWINCRFSPHSIDQFGFDYWYIYHLPKELKKAMSEVWEIIQDDLTEYVLDQPAHATHPNQMTLNLA